MLEHRLKNTGRKPIATSVYNHNFFTLDRQPTGPDIVVRFPFDPRAARALNGLAEVRGKELVSQGVQGPNGLHRGRRIRRHHTSDFSVITAGAGQACASPAIVRCRSCCSGPPGSRSVRSFYIDASVEPGKESSWRITYQFYQAASVKESNHEPS